MRRMTISVGGLALGIALVGCGTKSAMNHVPRHHISSSPHTSPDRRGSTRTGTPQSRNRSPQWWRLPLRARLKEPTMISAVVTEPKTSRLRLYLTSYPNAHDTLHGTLHTLLWDPRSQSLESANLPTSAVPHSSSPFHLISTSATTPHPQLMNGSAPAKVSWSIAVATYQSGENPASSPFGMDNRVIGQ